MHANVRVQRVKNNINKDTSNSHWKQTKREIHVTSLTLKLLEVINMYLLPIISLHYPANRLWEYSNLSGRSCYLDLTPNSHTWFTRIYVAAREEN